MSEKKLQKAICITEKLKIIYPSARCSLDYESDPWKLLIMGCLSAQCTDARVNSVCRELFSKYNSPETLSIANAKDVETIIRPCGLYRTKASNIIGISQKMIEEYGGNVPDSIEDLLRFPGVGRKIANLVLGDIFGKPAIVTDTHCIRICGRLGFYPENTKNPIIIEKILSKIIPEKEQSDFCHRLVLFGRDTCSARTPKCDTCPLRDNCNKYQIDTKGKK